MGINVNAEEIDAVVAVCTSLTELNKSYDFVPRIVLSVDIMPKVGSMVEWWTNGGYTKYLNRR
jgi:hypothetical protein